MIFDRGLAVRLCSPPGIITKDVALDRIDKPFDYVILRLKGITPPIYTF